MSTSLIIAITIDSIGILIGVISVWIIAGTKSQVAGIIGKGLGLIIWGVSFMLLAFLYTIVFARLNLFPVPGGVDIHHVLMTVGMLFFVVAALTFSKTGNIQQP